MKPQLAFATIGLALIAACADHGANDEPILDGAPTQAYQADLDANQTLARTQNSVDQETAAAAVLGAGDGAALGAADADGNALGGALAGALLGGVSSAVGAGERREAIVIECPRGHGHRVVG